MVPETRPQASGSEPDSSGISDVDRQRGGPAVVYFAKAPRPGTVKTRLCPPLTPAEAAGLYRGFLTDLLRPVAGIGASTYVFVWPEDGVEEVASLVTVSGVEACAQRGVDLWERMQNCFDQLFARGHDRVVLRNTDSPDLPDQVVCDALTRARPGRAVLGPDPGGGYYLIALCEPHPEWLGIAAEGGDTVLDATVARIRADGAEVELLPEYADVDGIGDLLALFRRRGGA